MAVKREKIWITPPLPGGVKVRHVGILDLDEFYRWLFRWFEFEGYVKESSDDFERFYLERETPKGKQIEIRWVARRKRSAYFSYVIEVIFLLLGVNDIEVQRGERKVKIQKGDFELRFGAYVEKGMAGAGILGRIYDKFLIRTRIEDYKLDLYDKFYKLHEEIKAYFNQYV